MALSKLALGMNARNFLYIGPHNKPSDKRRADDKLATKTTLGERGINAPRLLALFKRRSDARSFDWKTLPETFVVKPARGYGGEGIVIIKDWDGVEGKDLSGNTYDIYDLETHIFDILEGAYSLQSIPDMAFVEDRIIPQKFLKKLPSFGVSDIRVLVFEGVPVMAMLRVPTKSSGGKANLHQGAVGVGIDIATGITTYATLHNKKIEFFPGTKMKMRGIKIPMWSEILELSVEAQRAMGLGYAGVDIVMDANKGPMVLEVNARPGLSIQNANNASLRTRLERVSGIRPTPTTERGIDIARSLFAAPFSEKVIANDGPDVVGVVEPVVIRHEGGEEYVLAKIDTGAYRTSIDHTLAEKLGLNGTGKKVRVRSASGTGHRHTVNITFKLRHKLVTTIASKIDRGHMKYPMIIGRRDLKHFLVDPTLKHTELPKIESAEKKQEEQVGGDGSLRPELVS